MHAPLSLTGVLRSARRAVCAVAGIVGVVALFGCPSLDPASPGPTAIPTASELATSSTALAAGGGPSTPPLPPLPSAAAVDAGPRGAAAAPPTSADAPALDLVFWENQSWKPGGGADRLTLWADGRAEISVLPPGPGYANNPSLQLRPGWRRAPGERLRFVRSNPFPKAEGRRRFAQAVAAGIDGLKTFKPHYLDGKGTLVGFRRGGKVQEVVLPFFPEDQQGSENQRRYLRVAKAFADFDTQAY